MNKDLANVLAKGRIVQYDEDVNVFLVWVGGHTINAYALDCKAISCWSVGNFSKNSASVEEVIESMERRKFHKDYP